MSGGHKQEIYRKRNTNGLQPHSVQEMNTKKMSPHNTVRYPRLLKVFTHLEPDILECEVRWALGSITMNKASGGDGIPVEVFQILKDDALNCCTQYVSKFGKLSSGHRTGNGQFSFQSQRKAMPKNAQTTAQLHSSHTLGKSCSKFSKPGFSNT